MSWSMKPRASQAYWPPADAGSQRPVAHGGGPLRQAVAPPPPCGPQVRCHSRDASSVRSSSPLLGIIVGHIFQDAATDRFSRRKEAPQPTTEQSAPEVGPVSKCGCRTKISTSEIAVWYFASSLVGSDFH